MESLIASNIGHSQLLEEYYSPGQLMNIVNPLTGCYTNIRLVKHEAGRFLGKDLKSSALIMFSREDRG